MSSSTKTSVKTSKSPEGDLQATSFKFQSQGKRPLVVRLLNGPASFQGDNAFHLFQVGSLAGCEQTRLESLSWNFDCPHPPRQDDQIQFEHIHSWEALFTSNKKLEKFSLHTKPGDSQSSAAIDALACLNEKQESLVSGLKHLAVYDCSAASIRRLQEVLFGRSQHGARQLHTLSISLRAGEVVTECVWKKLGSLIRSRKVTVVETLAERLFPECEVFTM
jgi:hypothetical protein